MTAPFNTVRIHPDQAVVLDGAAVDDRRMADAHARADADREAEVGMHHDVVLQVAARPTMLSMSARTTAPKKTLASAAMVACPMTVAVGASHAARWMVGEASPNGRIRALTFDTLGSEPPASTLDGAQEPRSQAQVAQAAGPASASDAVGRARSEEEALLDRAASLCGKTTRWPCWVMASGMLNALDPRNDNPFDRDGGPERPPLGELLDSLVERGETGGRRPGPGDGAPGRRRAGPDAYGPAFRARELRSALVAGGARPARGGRRRGDRRRAADSFNVLVHTRLGRA